MGSALWAGVSGLNSSSTELDVIANNLSNVNTIGFKSGRTYFSDLLSQSLSGGSAGTMQIGRGVGVGAVQTQFSAGSFESTGNSTDVAIDGEGFFIVNDSEGASYYTRAGAFNLNSNGMLVDANGYKVQGRAVVDGTPTGGLTDINLSDIQSVPQVTSTFAIGANLNSTTATGGQYSTTQSVYDSLGSEHTLNITYTKTENATAGYWGIESFLDAAAADSISANGLIFDADGNLTQTYTSTAAAPVIGGGGAGTATVEAVRPGMIYQSGSVALTCTAAVPTATSWTVTSVAYPNAAIVQSADSSATHINVSLDGTGTTDLSFDLAGAWTTNNTATSALTHAASDVGDITIAFTSALPDGATIGAGGSVNWNLIGDDALNITQYATSSVIRAMSTDGYASGNLKTISIDKTGRISGSFTNGQTSHLAQLMLGYFSNPTALQKMGSNLFGETVSSGTCIQNYPGESGIGLLTPNSLEMSNTDIATEFIKMITAQKAYQASARVVTTQDEIMQTLMNIKR